MPANVVVAGSPLRASECSVVLAIAGPEQSLGKYKFFPTPVVPPAWPDVVNN